MKKRLKENIRARHLLVEKATAVPRNRTARKKKNFTVRVICAADYPHRIVKLENLQLDILHRKLYANMAPQNLFGGKFRVAVGYEQHFREIAKEHGFCASEVIEVD